MKMITSLTEDKNMSTVYGEEKEVMNNRATFFIKNNIPVESTLIIKSDHQDEVFELEADFINENKDLSKTKIDADAVITKCKNIFIYLTFGDCIPLGIYDAKKDILVMAHLSWKTAEKKLHKKVINILVNKYKSRVEDLQVIIGPSIKKESYQYEKPIQLSKDEWKDYITHVSGEIYSIDLNGYVENGLKELGIKNIENSNIDTVMDKRYYSHYRKVRVDKDEVEGRFICGVIMEDKGDEQ